MMPVFILVVFAALTLLAFGCLAVVVGSRDEDRQGMGWLRLVVSMAMACALVDYVLKHPEVMSVEVKSREAP